MAIKATRLGPGTLELGDTTSAQNFAALANKVTLEPNIDEGDPIVVLSGDEMSDDDVTWNLTGEVYQDIEDGATSLLKWCFDHSGDVVPFTFTPKSDAALTITGEVTVRPVAIGGDVKVRNTSPFTFRLSGDPVWG